MQIVFILHRSYTSKKTYCLSKLYVNNDRVRIIFEPLSDSFYILMFSLALVNILETIFWLLLRFTKVEETQLDLHVSRVLYGQNFDFFSNKTQSY